jgi:nicotinamidase-related amidase
MTVIAAKSTAIVILDDKGAEANAVRSLAVETGLLCLMAQAEGEVHGGETANQRVFTLNAGQAFYGTELDLLLRSNGIETVVFAGWPVGPMMLAASEAIAHGFKPVLVLAEAGLSEASPLLPVLFSGQAGPLCMAVDEVAAILKADSDPARSWHKDVKAACLLPTLHQRLDPAHTAYVLVDVQNDFCRVKRSATEEFSLVDVALPNIKVLLAGAREAGCTIVHVQAEYGPMFRSPGHPYRYPGTKPGQVVWTASASEFGANGPLLPDDEVEVCIPGTWGEEFTEVDVMPGEIVLRKHRYSAFIGTGLDVMLRKRGIRSVVIVGVATNVCVESTARDASMLDFYTVVAEDGVATRGSRERHDNALAEITSCFGMVVPTSRILDAWQRRNDRIETAA